MTDKATRQAARAANQAADKPDKPIRQRPQKRVNDINDNSGAQIIAPMAGPVGDYARIGKTRRIFQHIYIDDVPTAMLELIAEATEDWGTTQYTIESFAVSPVNEAGQNGLYHVLLCTMLEGRVL